MGNDDGGAVCLALVFEIMDGVHDSVVALGAASDDGNLAGVLRTVLGDDVLSLLHPSCRCEHEDSIKASSGAEFLESVHKDGLVAQIEELLRLVRVPHPNPRPARKNSSKLHVRSFSQLAALKTPQILLHPQFYHSLKPTTAVPRQSHIAACCGDLFREDRNSEEGKISRLALKLNLSTETVSHRFKDSHLKFPRIPQYQAE